MDFSDLSKSLTKSLSKEDKKENGIYFTPPQTIKTILDKLSEYTFRTVLEPSCGSCEFITEVYKRYPTSKITGIEYNEDIYKGIEHIRNKDIELIHDDFLKYKTEKKYDLIVGNPPYFVMKKGDVKKEYYPYFDGRPNIFILFVIKSLQMLEPNGILSLVLPKSFLNCLYYHKTRQYITENFTILNITYCDDNYIETKQETIILIVQNKKQLENSIYELNVNGSILFGDQSTIQELQQLYSGSTFLDKLGFNVHVGTIVWNQCKDILTDDINKTRLIYSSDINQGSLIQKTYKNSEKKN